MMEKSEGTLSPFVYWAQTDSVATLKVDLKSVKDPHLRIKEETVEFSANGVGAQGLKRYSFALHLSAAIDPDKCSLKVTDRQVDLTLCKTKKAWWPRLTAKPQKPAWLKIDFDKWKSEEDFDEDETRDIRRDFPEIYDKLQKEELGYRRESAKKIYLAIYNLLQFIGFSYVLIVMYIRHYKSGAESMEGTYEAVGPAMKFIQLMQFLEVLHPMFGYTKGSALTPFLQVTGRAIILFVMIEAEPRMQTKPVVFYLFLVWSMIEVVRYPYYITQLYNMENSILTWLRYTIWVPLYPLGFLCEGVVIIRDIPYYEETNRFSISMPNKWNFSFYLPTVMRIYLLFLCVPMMYFMMSHMYRTRVKKLGPKSWIRKYN
ncbi:very-long-chain (3R)-3-hydroxyacyl-CoA dehydratase 3 [Cloeon dipterum]|uniref:very-long-chain (3R)-3-hydroxyacyl-CoA dehydratase 3 n=1 Tax=Cloeon dipterum TaxID=197152 RepID=UPI0032200D38